MAFGRGALLYALRGSILGCRLGFKSQMPFPTPRRGTQSCLEASSTFWYNSIALYGTSGFGNITFENRRIPVKFSSSTFITPGNLYGLCVIAPDAGVIQDDFASGNAVAPVGDTVDLEIVLPGPSYADIAINVYFESEPAE